MPGGDGTGPGGMGPMTGRAAGYCAGYQMPGFMNPYVWGRGGGGGRGRRNWYYATGTPGWAGAAQGMPAWGMGQGAFAPAYPPYGPQAPYAPYSPQPNPAEELDVLKGQEEYLEDALEGIKKRIGELEAAKQEK